MKKYLKEIIILLIQLLMFYIIPLFGLEEDPMGMVFLMLIITFILSIIFGSISKLKYKYLYAVIIAILFIPTVFIYYNESALIHSLWYLIDSLIGITIGNVIFKVKRTI